MPENTGKMQGGEVQDEGRTGLTPVGESSGIPEIPEGGARVRVHYAGTVFTPKKTVPGVRRRTRTNSGLSSNDTPTGYEVSGVIDKISNKSGSSLQEGDHVIVHPDDCTTHDGELPKYILVRNVENIVRLPGELSLEVAALLPGGALLAYAAIKRARLIIQQKIAAASAEMPCNILIVGASGLGLWALKIAQYVIGCSENIHITVADVCIDKLMVCKDHGCYDVVHWNDSIHEEYILERTKDVCKGGVDVAIDFVSSARTINRLTKVLKQEGVIVVASSSKYDINISLNTLSEHDQCVIGVKGGSKGDLEEVVEIMASGKVTPPPFTVFPLDQANKALDGLQECSISGRTLLQMTEAAKQ